MAYEKFQATLSKKQSFVHFDLPRQLYINIDASKKRGISTMIFYLKAPSTSNFSFCSNIEPIIFLSYLLIPAETSYWLIKLEMAGLV